jgi:hypothetical protein
MGVSLDALATDGVGANHFPIDQENRQTFRASERID